MILTIWMDKVVHYCVYCVHQNERRIYTDITTPWNIHSYVIHHITRRQIQEVYIHTHNTYVIIITSNICLFVNHRWQSKQFIALYFCREGFLAKNLSFCLTTYYTQKWMGLVQKIKTDLKCMTLYMQRWCVYIPTHV